MDTGQIIVSRTSQYANSLRKVKILLDGELTAAIANGQTLALDVDPGPHVVEAALDWARTEPLRLEVKPGQVSRVETGCSLVGWRLLLAIIYAFRPRHYLFLRSA